MAGDLDVGTISGRAELDDNFSSVLDRINQKLEPFVKGAEGFGEGIKEFIENPLKFAKTEALEVVESLGPLGTGLIGIAGVAAGAAVGLVELGEKVAEAGEEALIFSRITGVAIEDVGRLKEAAEIGGGSLGSLQTMLFQVQRRMDATGEAADKFNRSLENLQINATEFRNSAPDEKINLLSKAMIANAGSATLMSDAIAVMGRGAMTNLPLLMKGFDELQEKSKGLAVVWTEEDAKAADEFGDSVRAVKVQVENLAIEAGQSLIPALTAAVHVTADLISGLKEMVSLGGAIPGFWHEFLGLLGEGKDKTEALLNVQSTFNRLVQEGEHEGLNYGEAIFDASEKMLKMGYATATVAEASGLAKGQIAAMKAEMEMAAKAAIQEGEAWERINQATAGFSDISPTVRGLVKDLFDAKAQIEDIATVTGLSKEQVKSLTEQFKEAEKAEKKFAEGWTELNSLGRTQADVLEGVNPKTQQLIEYYVQLGAKTEDLIKAFPELTKVQVEAIDATVKANQKAMETLEGLWAEQYQKKWELGATDLEKIEITAEIEYEKRVKAAQDAGVTDVAYYNALWALRQKDISNNTDALNQKLAAQKNHNAESAEVAQKASKIIAESALSGFAAIQAGADPATVQVKLLSGELVTVEEAMKRFNQGSSFTYDLSTREGIAQYRKMNPAADITWSDDQIMNYIEHGGSLEGLIKSGVINPYAHMGGFATGGFGDFGTGTPVMLHGKEVVAPFDSFLSSIGGGYMGGKGGDVHIHIANPVFTDAASMRRTAKQLGNAHIDLMRSQGWRPGQVRRG